MRKAVTRVILFITAVPAIIGIILFLPFRNFLSINVLFIVIAFFSNLEAGKLVLKSSAPLIRYTAAVFTALFCSWVFIDTAGFLSPSIPISTIGTGLFIGSTIVIFFFALLIPGKREIPTIISRAGGGAFLLLYPGLFFIFCIKITGLKYPAFLLLFLILTVFLSDALAYVLGKLFGKKSRIITDLSPNKTLIGFLTEIIFCCAASFTAAVVFPLRFSLAPVWAAFFGIGLGITSIIGDLFESALKRAADVKDSGRIIPGRGGFLDSIDSLLFSAPFFYFVLRSI